MNDEQTLKYFIDYICTWISEEYHNTRHNRYRYCIHDSELLFILLNKSIESQIFKQIQQRLNLECDVISKSQNGFQYELYVKLYTDKPKQLIKKENEVWII